MKIELKHFKAPLLNCQRRLTLIISAFLEFIEVFFTKQKKAILYKWLIDPGKRRFIYIWIIMLMPLQSHQPSRMCALRERWTSATIEESIPAPSRPHLCAEQYAFIHQEPKANGHQVLHGMGLHACHQYSVRHTQDDLIDKEVAQEKVVDNDKSDINNSYVAILPQISVGRIAIKTMRKMTP